MIGLQARQSRSAQRQAGPAEVLLAFLAATIGIMGVLLLGAGGGPTITSSVTLFQLLGYNLLLVSLLLILRVLIIVFRPERPRRTHR